MLSGQFLVDHVERVIHGRGKVTVLGSVQVRSPSGETRLQFRLKGEIDRAAVRINGQRRRFQRPEERPIASPILTEGAADFSIPWAPDRSIAADHPAL